MTAKDAQAHVRITPPSSFLLTIVRNRPFFSSLSRSSSSACTASEVGACLDMVWGGERARGKKGGSSSRSGNLLSVSRARAVMDDRRLV